MSIQPSLRIVDCFRSPVGGLLRNTRHLLEAQVLHGCQMGAGWAAQMPDQERLKALFGVNMMATRIEQAYFAALSRRNHQKDI
jgi:hypothetical protein